jgi:hypothetical protein
MYQLHVGVSYTVAAAGCDNRQGIGKFFDLLDRVDYLRDFGSNEVATARDAFFDESDGM